MRDLFIFIINFAIAYLRALSPGGAKALAMEYASLRYQIAVSNRGKKRAPNLKTIDRFIFGILPFFIKRRRIVKLAIILKPATILKLHKALVAKKYQNLFSSKTKLKPGPKGPSQEIIDAVIEFKRLNPRFGYPRIAMSISNVFGIKLHPDQVRRILEKHFTLKPDGGGPSWLSFQGNLKDSLWSVDFFRCESAFMKTHWVMVIMDQFTRRIIGFAVHAGDVNGITACCMFNQIIKNQSLPTRLSSDNDPLFKFHRWKANLRILEIKEIKSIPHIPLSHPFVERLVGSVRRELLDQTLFLNATDLQRKLDKYKDYFNESRTHYSLDGKTPAEMSSQPLKRLANLNHFGWKSHCRGLFHTPVPT